jgi:hypothetical protein
LSLTAKQEAAREILSGDATHVILFGGSRSGKTFLLVRQVVQRALNAPGSRHAILRFRFNHLKASIILDTFPKVMEVRSPGVTYHLDKSDWYAELGRRLADLVRRAGRQRAHREDSGQEHATLYLNECSQIPWRRGIRRSLACPAGDDQDSGAGASVAQAPHVLRLQPAIEGALVVQAVRPEDRPGYPEDIGEPA